MRFSVSHETLYRYSVPVSLAPHLLRLDPRLDGGRLLSRELFVEPRRCCAWKSSTPTATRSPASSSVRPPPSCGSTVAS